MTEAAADTKTSGRIAYLDIAKGVGIFLVVWAHAEGPYNRYLYQFFLPFFFLISGILYKKEVPLKKFLIRRIQGLYIPFVFWNLVIHTFAALKQEKTVMQVLKFDLNIILLRDKDGQFLGATWFLASLFIISVLYKLVDTLVGEARYKDAFMLVVFGTLTLIGFEETLPYGMSRTFILGIFYAMGVFAVRHREELMGLDGFWTACLGALLFLLIGYYGRANMGKNIYAHPLQFVIGAVFISYSILYWCRWLEKQDGIPGSLKKILLLFGTRSMDIMIWQFVAFRFVIILQMMLNHEEITAYNILQYYPVYSTDGAWWIAYLLVGLVLPLLFCAFLRTGPWGRLFKKMHIV